MNLSRYVQIHTNFTVTDKAYSVRYIHHTALPSFRQRNLSLSLKMFAKTKGTIYFHDIFVNSNLLYSHNLLLWWNLLKNYVLMISFITGKMFKFIITAKWNSPNIIPYFTISFFSFQINVNTILYIRLNTLNYIVSNFSNL